MNICFLLLCIYHVAVTAAVVIAIIKGGSPDE